MKDAELEALKEKHEKLFQREKDCRKLGFASFPFLSRDALGVFNRWGFAALIIFTVLGIASLFGSCGHVSSGRVSKAGHSSRPTTTKPASVMLNLGCSTGKNDHRRELIGKGGWVTVETIDDCLTPWVDATGLKFGTLACIMVQNADDQGKYEWEKVCPKEEYLPKGVFVRFKTLDDQNGGSRVIIRFVPS